MSRSELGTIDPDLKSGTQLTLDLTAFELAQNSLHSDGTAVRPSYAVAKTIWVDDSAIPWKVNMYDGTTDIVLGTVDTTGTKFIPGASALANFTNIKQAASDITTGVVELVTQAEADGNTGGDRAITSDVLNAGNYALRLQTESVTTSGTTVDYTAIPSWVKKVTVLFAGVSTTGTSIPIIQLGDSGGFETTGYLGAASGVSTTVASTVHNTGFLVNNAHGAANVYHGRLVLSLEDQTNNVWAISGILGLSSVASTSVIGGAKALSAVLTQLRLTTVGGVDTFDAGAINITYE